jgi:hypothetical protein
MQKLVLPGRRRIHFHKERPEQRSRILDTIRRLPVRATVYDATAYRRIKIARDACLIALVADLAKIDGVRVVLEVDDSTFRARDEALLAIPDAVAWSWAKGGHWRAMVRSIISDVRRV